MTEVAPEDRTEKDILQMDIVQLKKELKLDREKVSKVAEEMKQYVESQLGEDPLVNGVPDDKNPFKEKGGCIIC